MKLVIIGAGPAGLTVAEKLRAHGVDADIVMISSEPYPPYAPPAMADFFVTGREQSIYWKGRDVCDRLDIDYRSGTRVMEIDPSLKHVMLDGAGRVPYDHLVIDSGSNLYAPIEGRDLPGVFNFKSMTAASKLVDEVRRGQVEQVLIVGAGFIGVEVALLLTELDVDVAMVEMMDRVMPRTLDLETASIVLAELQRRGIVVRLESKASGFEGVTNVENLVLDSGESLTADAYVAATGVKPNVDFLAGSGLDVGWGVRVDDRLRTNIPGISAAGDVAETFDRLTGERYVHAIFPNAVAQAKVVADGLAGYDVAYEGSETMNSLKHLGVPVMTVGASSGSEELRWRTGDQMRKVFLSDGRIVGFQLAGATAGAGVLRSLMLKRMDVTPLRDRLVAPDFGVADVAFPALA
ncbi:MAG TPA: NAD(P)/FAD-dependent oxidoreductase [Actinobacteria bacterium]|nr:NAD(P)/FAD-dependent oxidoreductase [Actinomycetota bacterium]